MKVVGFDGKEHKLVLASFKQRNNREHSSSNQSKVRNLIKTKLPRVPYFEEVTLPGTNKPRRSSLLYADFFIPSIPLIIEVHGRQHYEFCPFFHKTKMDFYKGQARDRDKIEWCELNNIKIVVLPHDKEAEWEAMISEKILS